MTMRRFLDSGTGKDTGRGRRDLPDYLLQLPA